MKAVGFISDRRKTQTLTVCICLLTLLCVFSSSALKGAVTGLELCFYHVIPSTFPFLVLSSLINDCISGGRSRLLSSFLSGNLSGYPVGAKLCRDLISKESSPLYDVLTLSCCIGAGPGFIIGAVGTGILKNTYMGLFLFLAQLLSSFTCLFLLFFLHKGNVGEKTGNGEFHFSSSFTGAVKEGVSACLNICGFVTLFSCFIRILQEELNLSGIAGTFTFGLLEISSGCSFAESNMGLLGFALLGGLLGFGGLSVFCQLTAITQKSNVTIKALFLSRVLSFVLQGFYTLILFSVFKDSIETAAFDGDLHSISHNPLPLAFCLCTLFCVLLICDKRTGEIKFRLKNVKKKV